MKSVSLISAIIGLSLAANAMGADDETVEASKRAAVDTCRMIQLKTIRIRSPM